MAEMYSDEWYGQVLAAAGDLPVVPGASFVFDVEISDAPGKKRAHGRVVDGQLRSLVAGKFVAAEDGETLQVNFATKGKYMGPLLSGETAPLVAYMRGELKVDGEYELVIDHFANQCDSQALGLFRDKVGGLSD